MIKVLAEILVFLFLAILAVFCLFILWCTVQAIFEQAKKNKKGGEDDARKD